MTDWWTQWWEEPQDRWTCLLCERATEGLGDLYGRCAECRDGNEVRVGLRAEKLARTFSGFERPIRSCIVCGKPGRPTCGNQCTRAAALRHCFLQWRDPGGTPGYDLRGAVLAFEVLAAQTRVGHLTEEIDES
jgi:hypothetical protein